MDIRSRILKAAAHVYAQHGFRGATTRLIAIEAGVNEVTLFRTFGSKAALFEAMMHSQTATTPLAALPDDPQDPQAELTTWCDALLAHMRESRSLIRKTFGELEERPDAAIGMCQGPNCAAAMLMQYVDRLRETDRADPEADVATAVSMFMSAMFGDAISRDVIPDAFPQPVEDAPAKYVNTFLRAVGAHAANDVVPLAQPDSPRTRRAAAQ